MKETFHVITAQLKFNDTNNISRTPEMSTRFLTEEEIYQVLTYIPKPVCADKREHGLSETIHQQQLDVLATVLRTVTIVPEEIPTLGKELAKSFNRAVVDPGTAIGTLASQAVGEPATQGKLKNFMGSGSLRARSYNADRISEILGVVGTQRYRNMTIVFEDKDITYERVLREYRPKFVGVPLHKLVKDFATISMDDSDFESVRKEWWDPFSYIYGLDRTIFSRNFLRIYIDPVKAGMYKITMPMISNAIKSGNNGSFLAVIFSPMAYGVIDVFVLPGAEIKGTSGKSLKIEAKDDITFIDNVLRPIITGKEKDIQLQISGVKGIVDMIPVELKVSSLISKVLDRSFGIYDVYVNVRQEALLGVPRSRIKEALKAVGCKIVKIPSTEIYYSNERIQPLFIRCQASDDPSKLIDQAFASLVVTLEDGTKVRDYNNPLYQKLVYVYAETEGNNLRDILSIPGVDKNHTISNDLKEVREVLGIQAARNFIIQEVMTVIETLGTKIHQSHVMLIADSMSRNHNLLPVSFQGTNKNLGPFTNMAFERAGETVLTASRGETEFVSSVSSQIGTGRVITSGTGAVDVLPNEDPSMGLTPKEAIEIKPAKVVPNAIVNPVGRLVTNLPKATSVPTITTNPLVRTVTNANVVTPNVANILARRRQVLNNIVDKVTIEKEQVTEPTVCPRVPENTILYVFSVEDVPIPLIANSRKDLFSAIAQSIDLYTDVNVEQRELPQVKRPLVRHTALPKITSNSILNITNLK